MTRKFYDSHISEVQEFFANSQKFQIEKVDVTAGLDCGDHAYFEFEAKPEFNNFGYHWEVVVEKSTGAMTIVDGI